MCGCLSSTELIWRPKARTEVRTEDRLIRLWFVCSPMQRAGTPLFVAVSAKCVGATEVLLLCGAKVTKEVAERALKWRDFESLQAATERKKEQRDVLLHLVQDDSSLLSRLPKDLVCSGRWEISMFCSECPACPGRFASSSVRWCFCLTLASGARCSFRGQGRS